MSLIPVHEAQNRALATSVCELLKQVGIQATMEASSSGAVFSARMGGAVAPFDPWTVYVAEQDADRARAVLLAEE